MSYHLIELVQRLGHPRLLVLGDLILDRYVWGDAERISQEAPVILLREDRQEVRLGGAANVVNMLRGLEARATIASVTGSDADAATLRDELASAGVDCSLLVEDAARRLANELQGRPLHDPLVLAIPRGGVVGGAVLARELGGDLDVILSRKLPAPGKLVLASP